jgi:signal transduction histidine kinase
MADNGVGIDPKEWAKIFEPYKRLNYSTKGRGLGLYLVKTQVEAMNGRVEISSSCDQGSTFSIFLPSFPMKRSEVNDCNTPLNNAFNELIA